MITSREKFALRKIEHSEIFSVRGNAIMERVSGFHLFEEITRVAALKNKIMGSALKYIQRDNLLFV